MPSMAHAAGETNWETIHELVMAAVLEIYCDVGGNVQLRLTDKGAALVKQLRRENGTADLPRPS